MAAVRSYFIGGDILLLFSLIVVVVVVVTLLRKQLKDIEILLTLNI